MSNMLQKQENVRFHFCAGINLVVLFVMFSPIVAVTVSKECIEVATYAQKWITTGGNAIEIKQLVNFINCMKELYKMYKTTDSTKVPQEVREIIRKVPNLGKIALAIAKREGLCFLSVYLLYRTVDLYDRAMNLDMDYKMHWKEFEWLQMELQPVIHLIHEELLPNWKQLSISVLLQITRKVNEKLSRYHVELKQLVRVIHSDIKKGSSDRRWAVGYTFVSFALSVVSISFGSVLGTVCALFPVPVNLYTVWSLTATVDNLKSLQNDVELMCNEIVEYRFLLQQMASHSLVFNFIFNLTFFFLVFALYMLPRSPPTTEHRSDAPDW